MTDKKSEKQAEFTRQHTISPAQFKRLIAEKMERARAYSKVVENKRESLAENRQIRKVCKGNEVPVCTLNMDERAATRMESLVWEEKLVRIKAFFKNRQPKYFRVL